MAKEHPGSAIRNKPLWHYKESYLSLSGEGNGFKRDTQQPVDTLSKRRVAEATTYQHFILSTSQHENRHKQKYVMANMPFFWKSKLGASKRNIIPPETMKAAVIKVVEEKGSINKIAKEYGIDRKTLGSSESSQEEEDFWEKSSSDDLNFDDEDMLHTIDQGDFALVKFKTKSSFCYFVSRVVKKESNDDYYVTFLRRSEPGFKQGSDPEMPPLTIMKIGEELNSYPRKEGKICNPYPTAGDIVKSRRHPTFTRWRPRSNITLNEKVNIPTMVFERYTSTNCVTKQDNLTNSFNHQGVKRTRGQPNSPYCDEIGMTIYYGNEDI
uniref:HTH psq-type domain-containing protein n=1 Tax=Timema tahoe TaxID=61484 RepID=A0A7R9INN0_9NEOP|nr:unnamed protein product [Timema tahoe]